MTTHVKESLQAMFSGLTFDSQRHLYFWEGERVKKSVTGLVEEFCPEFDKEYWLPICAKKEGITIQELDNRWQRTNKDACELGTETHDFLEHYNGLQSPTTPFQVAGISFLKDITEEYEIVCRELRMYSRLFKFAGTMDLLLRCRNTGNLVIADYKTNKDLFKTYGMMLEPFGYLENHPYNHYQLQLSYYQLMLEEVGAKISKRIVIHLKPDSTYRTFETLDFTQDLREHMTQPKKEYLW